MSVSLRLKLIRSRELSDRQQTARVEAGCSLGAALSGIGADLLVLSGQTREAYIHDAELEPRHIEEARRLRKRLGDAISAYESDCEQSEEG